MKIPVLLLSVFLWFGTTVSAQLTIDAIDGAGDSIMKGFNAGNAFPCANGDQENFNWLTSDTRAGSFCGTGSEGVYSFLERLECELQRPIIGANPNHAASGARMLSDFVNQANGVKTFLSSQSGQKLAVVFLGHNDNCSGSLTKTNASCTSADLDPNDYCRTRPASFERELRRGLDIMMTTPGTRIGVMAPVRVSQLCNFSGKANCQFGGTCQTLWNVVNVCGSLTRQCSDDRIADTFNTMSGYREVLKRVAAEYAAIPSGGTSPVVVVGGQTVGGATLAAGVDFIYSDAPWFYKFNTDQLSCCDCFHPSGIGQDQLARMMKTGLNCTRLQPCCRDSGNATTDGKCARTEVKRVYYRGLL